MRSGGKPKPLPEHLSHRRGRDDHCVRTTAQGRVDPLVGNPVANRRPAGGRAAQAYTDREARGRCISAPPHPSPGPAGSTARCAGPAAWTTSAARIRRHSCTRRRQIEAVALGCATVRAPVALNRAAAASRAHRAYVDAASRPAPQPARAPARAALRAQARRPGELSPRPRIRSPSGRPHRRHRDGPRARPPLGSITPVIPRVRRLARPGSTAASETKHIATAVHTNDAASASAEAASDHVAIFDRLRRTAPQRPPSRRHTGTRTAQARTGRSSARISR